MGLLTYGKALDSAATTRISAYIREHGITQFLSTYHRMKDISGDELKFGDEIECGVFVVDSVKKTVKLSVRSRDLLQELEEKEQGAAHQSEGCTWHPEFGNWMIESTPSRPYSNYASDLLRVERNMLLRRRRLLSSLRPDEIAPTVTCFPLMGVEDFIFEPQPFSAPHSQSKFLPDYIVNPHPRFAALTRNIRTRRTEKVDIQMPLFHDVNTPEFLPQQKTTAVDSNNNSSKDDATAATTKPLDCPKFALEPDTNIHMDAMGFGMGMCCLQVTFQAVDIDESRYIYDNLAVLAPIMLAMTAATPFFKGRVSDVDARWNAIAQSVDDRTPCERNLVPLDQRQQQQYVDPFKVGDGIRTIPKSRYDSISTYIYHCNGDPSCHRTFERYNDIPCPIDQPTKERLLLSGVDENLAHHLAHLYTRDPLVVFEEKIELDDNNSMEHFENIQSTNWQTCRWKPPPPQLSEADPHIGWRTEFRSMEVQPTDFENAAFTVFIVLVTRVILAFDLALYIPLSQVDENMRRAHVRNGAQSQKFYFRKHVAPPPQQQQQQQQQQQAESTQPCNHQQRKRSASESQFKEDIWANVEEMTMEEIFLGKDCYYPGLIPLASAYLDYINTDSETRSRVDTYLDFIAKRAKGELLTPATWMRGFVNNHPSYNKDSILTQDIVHDLLLLCQQIGDGSVACPELHGNVKIDRVRPEDAYGKILQGRLPNEERKKLISRLMERGRNNRNSNNPASNSNNNGKTSSSSKSTATETISEGDESNNNNKNNNDGYAHLGEAIQADCKDCAI